MKEFGQKGFKNASTDTIVKDAEISKGALFHYFNNKKDLYLYLYDYSLEILKNEMLMKINFNEKDFFQRRRQALVLKIEVLNKHPEVYDFLGTAYLEDAVEVKSELESKTKVVMAYGMGKLFEDIDTSKFKEDIDVQKAIEIVSWSVEGFANKKKEVLKNMSIHDINQNELLIEFDVYLEMLKKCFYK